MRIIVGYFFVDRLQSEQANFVSTTILPEVREFIETHFLAIMAHCGYIFTLLWLQRGEAHEVDTKTQKRPWNVCMDIWSLKREKTFGLD